MTIFIRLISIILLFELGINAQDYSMSKYETDDNRYIKLKSSNGNCVVQYHKYINDGSYLTDCFNYKTSNEGAVFCTRDINDCITHDAVNYFLVSGKSLKNSKISTKPPFYGKKYFNFMGGSGTGQSLEIDKNNNVILYSHGVANTYKDYAGPYNDLSSLGFILYDNIICSKEKQSDMLCTQLN